MIKNIKKYLYFFAIWSVCSVIYIVYEKFQIDRHMSTIKYDWSWWMWLAEGLVATGTIMLIYYFMNKHFDVKVERRKTN